MLKLAAFGSELIDILSATAGLPRSSLTEKPFGALSP